MAYVPIPLSEDSLNPQTSIESPPDLNTFHTMGLSFENSALTTPEAFAVEKSLSVFPNKQLKDWATNSLKETLDQNNYLIQHTKTNVFNAVGDLGASIVGAISPVNILTGKVVESSLKGAAEEFIPKAAALGGTTGFIAKHLAQFGIGAVEAGAIVTPMAISTKGVYNLINEPESWKNVAENIGIGGAMGGTIRGVFGFRNTIEPTDAKNIAQLALNEINSGKKIDVEALYKNAMEQADKADPKTLESLQAEKEINNSKIEETSSQLSEAQKNFDEAIKKHPKSTFEVHDGRRILKNAIDIIGIPESERTPAQNKLIDSLPDTHEIKTALVIKNLPEAELTKSQKGFIDRFDNGEEDQLIKERLEEQKKQISNIDEFLKDDSLEENKKNDLIDQKAALKDEIKKGKERLSALVAESKEPKYLKKSRLNLIETKEKLEELKNTDQGLNAWISLKSIDHPAASKEELTAAFNSNNSWESDTTVYSEQAKNEINADDFSKKNLITDENVEAKTNELMDVLGEHDKSATDEIERKASISKEITDRFKKGLDNVRKCLIGKANG